MVSVPDVGYEAGMAQHSPQLPSVGEVLAPVLQRVPLERQPLLIAAAERLAAQRYRSWAEAPEVAVHAEALRACADREEEIARRIESLYPDAAAAQQALLAATPEVETINRTLFEGRPLADQFAIQAAGERLGSATWKAFARREQDPKRSDLILSCSKLEEDSAVVLEGILGSK